MINRVVKFAFVFFLTVGGYTAWSNDGTGGKEEKNPSGQEQQQDDKRNQQEVTEAGAGFEGPSSKMIEDDSLKDDSINKYNFIFHYLFKFKYDQEEGI